MPSSKETPNVTLAKPGDWLEWYDSLRDLAREYDLEDLVDLEKEKPVAEILLPRPERPNPLILFPDLLDALPPTALWKVASRVRDVKGVAVEPPRYTLIRNQAVEDDALVHLTSAQATGWSTRLSMYESREREWRSQKHNVLALRRWIADSTDPLFDYCTRDIEGVREVVERLQRLFPPSLEEHAAYKEYQQITGKAGQGLGVDEWFRQWCHAYYRIRRLDTGQLGDYQASVDFLKAARRYIPIWSHNTLLRVMSPKAAQASALDPKTPSDLIRDFHRLNLHAPPSLREVPPWLKETEEQNGPYHCPCHSNVVSHKPEACVYVKAAITGLHPPKRRLKEKLLSKTRDALEEPRWAWLVDEIEAVEICRNYGP
ncbi:hypothetical protein C8A00DRAFT_29864 [Chaetomidium leptoderma]|uniref:Uncharacterized protein n=1 Tax=Chaetomidium leptoderma TaxID=669021 RepID=A0AAN6VT44_9PEZI|nr:hypothetical protein C8A00DRAFT_29864 [Chaetomidium leptoderma]